MVIPGIPYHVTQRGNNRQPTFFSEQDYLSLLMLIKTYARRYRMDVLGYCLMPNHSHVLGIAQQKHSFANAMGHSHARYAQQINAATGRVGHLWQGRFYSCPLDGEHCWNALRYIERNPVRAGLVTHAWDYPWSSAAAHSGGVDRFEMLSPIPWVDTWDVAGWRETLALCEDDSIVHSIRTHTYRGKPLGNQEFCAQFCPR